MDVNTVVEATERTPALDAARAEYADIASNPQNPRYAAFRQGDAQVSAYIDALYRKALPDSTPIPFDNEGVTVGGPVELQPDESPEEAEIRTRNEVIVAPLKQKWGADYERRIAASEAGMRTLFAGKGEILDELGTIIRMEYGTKGEAAVLELFAELEDSKQGGRT